MGDWQTSDDESRNGRAENLPKRALYGLKRSTLPRLTHVSQKDLAHRLPFSLNDSAKSGGLTQVRGLIFLTTVQAQIPFPTLRISVKQYWTCTAFAGTVRALQTQQGTRWCHEKAQQIKVPPQDPLSPTHATRLLSGVLLVLLK